MFDSSFGFVKLALSCVYCGLDPLDPDPDLNMKEHVEGPLRAMGGIG